MDEQSMQHGLDWSPEVDLAGWWCSEKFNGCRAYWDGSTLWSRGGLAIALPDTWRQALPPGIHLDGEVYDGPDGLTRCTAAVRWGRFLPGMTYRVFDNPEAGHGVSWRMRLAEVAHVWAPGSAIVQPVEAWQVASTEAAMAALDAILAAGGEGLMLRHPALAYRAGRTPQMRKLTAWQREQYLVEPASMGMS